MKSPKVSVAVRSSCRRNSSRYSSVRRVSSVVDARASNSHRWSSRRCASPGVPGPFDRQHLGAPRAHLGALDRVVVQEHEAVEAEVQPAGERAEVLRLGQPVDHRRDDVLAEGEQIPAGLEDAPHVGFLVLAAQADEHALSGEANKRAVQREVPLVQIDPLGANFTDHAAPEGVVAIDHDHLAQGSHAAMGVAHRDRREREEIVVLERDVADLVAQRIVDRAAADAVLRVILRGRDDLEARDSAHRLDRARFGLRDERDERGAAAVFRRADEQQRVGRRLRAVRPHRPGEVVRRVLQVGAHELVVCHLFIGKVVQPIADPDEHDVEAAPLRVERARGVQQRLEDLAVGRDLERCVQLEFLQPEPERREQRIGGEGRREADGEIRRGLDGRGTRVLDWRKFRQHRHVARLRLARERPHDVRGGLVRRNRSSDRCRRVVPERLEHGRARDQPGRTRRFAAHRPDERLGGVLDCDVVAEPGGRIVHERGGGARDRPAALVQQAGKDGEWGLDEPQVLADVLRLARECLRAEPQRDRPGARVQDEHVEALVAALDRIERRRAPAGVPCVPLEEGDRGAAFRQPALPFLPQRIVVARADVDVAVREGQRHGEFRAEAAAAADDQRDLAVEAFGAGADRAGEFVEIHAERAERDVAAQERGGQRRAGRGPHFHFGVEQPEQAIESHGAGAVLEIARRLGRRVEGDRDAREQRLQAGGFHPGHVAAEGEHARLVRRESAPACGLLCRHGIGAVDFEALLEVLDTVGERRLAQARYARPRRARPRLWTAPAAGRPEWRGSRGPPGRPRAA